MCRLSRDVRVEYLSYTFGLNTVVSCFLLGRIRVCQRDRYVYIIDCVAAYNYTYVNPSLCADNLSSKRKKTLTKNEIKYMYKIQLEKRRISTKWREEKKKYHTDPCTHTHTRTHCCMFMMYKWLMQICKSEIKMTHN